MKSSQGLEISTENARVAGMHDRFLHRILRVVPGAEEILAQAAELPDEPVLQLDEAVLWLFAQTRSGQASAGAALARVRREALRTERERCWLEALRHWHAREFEAAAIALERITGRWPEDLAALKVCEFIYYILGQQHNGTRFLAHTARLERVHRGDPDFQAMRAFANELCGNMMAAREAAEASLATDPHNAWAEHALEHVLLWEGNTEAAIAVMRNWIGDWEASARPIHSHNAWHLALAHVDRLEFDAAEQVFDTHVWMKTPSMVVEQIDSISFLWRAEMAEAPVLPDRWREITDVIAADSDELFMPFSTAHFAYALARADAGEPLERLLSAVSRRADESDDEARRVWEPVGRDVVLAAAACGAGRYAEAAERFDAVMPRLTEIGGSDAQDDLFRFAHIHSLRESGRKSDALKRLTSRLESKTPSALEDALLSTL